MKKLIGIILAIIIVGGVYAFALSIGNTSHQYQANRKIAIVAAENFYGDIAQQIGGSHVSVTSILSDPNADPHEYESSVPDGIAVANADIIIENGSEYDTWMDKLLSASPNKNRVLLVAAKIAPHPLSDNPHVWYGIDNVQIIAQRIAEILQKADPQDSAEFASNLQTFQQSLQSIQDKITGLKSQYNGTPVGLTETIYLYQTQPAGLNVLTPFNFEKAIAEGNDPSADDVALTNNQIANKQIKVLIYNNQTNTPVTSHILSIAQQVNIPVVPVSETMPRNKHYQSWMIDQLTNLQNALQSTK